VPIPAALIAQMKEKFLSLATKPMKKVAEARARKRKRAGQKLKAAKKQVMHFVCALTLMNCFTSLPY
jgi:AdoMet-dependent rRNA methyltransferase SPB1